MEKTPLIIIGGGAQAKYALDCFSLSARFDVREMIVDARSDHLEWPAFYNTRISTGFEHIEQVAETEAISHAIVCLADPSHKEEMIDRVEKAGFELASAIHPRAIVSSSAYMEDGCIVNANAVIQPFARIGKGVMIHANVVVEHDCKIGAFTNLAPGVTLAGWVNIGPRATLYTGVKVIPLVQIGADVVVAAGSTVIRDIANGQRVAGSPASLMKPKSRH